MSTHRGSPKDVEVDAEDVRKRAAAIAAMPTKTLLAEGTDEELQIEARRVGREYETPRRTWAIGHKEALTRLDRGLARLPAYAEAALAAVRKDVIDRPDGPSPHVLAAALVALDAAARHGNYTDRLKGALQPDGQTIAVGDPRGENAARRRMLGARRTAIGEELERRALVRRGVLAANKGRK